MGKQVGYIRVSTVDQNTARQLENLQLDKVFIDRASGKDANRPQLEAMLDYVRDGDCVYVHSMDRLARNLEDLRRIVSQLNEKQVPIQFLKENLCFNGKDGPLAHLLLSIMGAFAEFERQLISERQREGIKLAQIRGVYRGRKRILSHEQTLVLQQRIEAGESKSKLANELGMSRETLYQYLKRIKTTNY